MTALGIALAQPFNKGGGGSIGSTDPYILTLSPNTAVTSASPLTVTVNGLRFTATSVVYAGAVALTTTFVNANQLTASYTPSSVGTFAFTVHEGAVISNSRDFTVTAVPSPTISTLSPNTAPSSASPLTVTVTGTNFVGSSVVYAGAVALTTTYVSATSLTCSYTPAVEGTASFTVHNGADISNSLNFTITSGSAFNPGSIAGLQEWWDSADVSSFTFSSGVVISQWRDKSGNVKHLSQGVVANQPTRDGAGRPFPTYHNFASRYMEYIGSSGVNVGTATIFIVGAEYTEEVLYAGFLSLLGGAGQNDTDNAGSLLIGASNSSYRLSASRNNGASATPGTGPVPYGIHRAVLRPDGNINVYNDGLAISSTPTFGPFTVANLKIIVGDRYYLGAPAGSYLNGDIAEILIYDSVLSAADIEQVETYLRAKWATPAPFVPTDIAGLAGWWDSNDASTFTYSSGTVVSGWNDKSGNGKNMAQAVVIEQPSRSGLQNALPTITHTPSGNHSLKTANVSIVATTPYTLYLACRPNLKSSYQTTIVDTADLGRPILSSDTANVKLDTFGGSFLWPCATADDQPLVYSFVVAPNPNGKAFRNGVLVNSANHNGWGIQFGLRTGKMPAQETWRSFYHNYFEILAYSGAHTTAQRESVEQYLRAKWGTP